MILNRKESLMLVGKFISNFIVDQIGPSYEIAIRTYRYFMKANNIRLSWVLTEYFLGGYQ